MATTRAPQPVGRRGNETPASQPGPGLDRLTGQDLSMLWPDDYGWPQDIGVIAVLDGAGLFEADGRLRIKQVREAISSRLHLVPRLRQIVHNPRWGLGRPLWVDVPCFDVADHVGVLPLAAPADERQLLRACERLYQRRLDKSRPLWQLWLLPGLPDGRVGLFMKMHHVVADGVAGVAIFDTLLDHAPAARPAAAPPWTRRPVPSARELLIDNVRRRAMVLSAATVRLASPIRTGHRIRATWSVLKDMLAERAPTTSLNQPIGSDRHLALCQGRLYLAKDAAHTAGAKVNDVVLAAITGGLRDLLRSRGEPVDGLVLRAAVPVSLHRDKPGLARGNLDGGMIVPLPVGEPDPSQRLRLIAAETAQRKPKAIRPAEIGVTGSAIIRKSLIRRMDRQPLVNVYVANVPGPPVPLYLAGARLLEIYPVVPLTGNITLGFGVLSYSGQLNFTATTDHHGTPDLPVFMSGLQQTLAETTHAIPAGSTSMVPA
jgi:diacylglycerol O-acyltransferase / wax synthase